jgi:hypothetical protein
VLADEIVVSGVAGRVEFACRDGVPSPQAGVSTAGCNGSKTPYRTLTSD